MSPIAEVGSAFVSVMPSARGFGSKLDSQVSGDLKNSGSKAGKVFGAALKVGALGVLAGAAVVGNFLKGSIDEAREAQKVTALTESTIKSTGGAAKITADQVGAMAERLSELTGIDDETIQSGENMLLTFKNIRNEVDGKFVGTFDEATAALIDMSSAMGTEPKQAAIQLGKALNDPIKGVSALGRAGVQFSDGQKKVIEQLVKTGDTAGAQKVILHELNSEFGGAAEAQATAGDKMEVAWGNLKETAGNAILPVVDKYLPKLTNGINSIAEDIRNHDWSGLWDKFKNATVTALTTQHRLARDFFVNKLIPAINTGLGKAREAWADKWEDFWKDPAKAYDKTIHKTKFFGTGITGAAENSAKDSAFAFIKAFNAIPRAAGRIGVQTLNSWRQAMAGLPRLATHIAVDVEGSFFQGVASMPDRARGLAVAVGGSFQNGMAGAISAARSIGVNIIMSMVEGVQGAAGNLVAAAVSAADAALNAVKGHLKIGSPSRVFMEIGHQTMEGMALGIEDGHGRVASAMDRLSAGVVVRGPGVLAAAGAGGGGRAALTITNWDEGVGFIEYVADGRIHGANQLAGETARAM